MAAATGRRRPAPGYIGVLITVHQRSVRASSSAGRAPYLRVTRRTGSDMTTTRTLRTMIMKTFVSALVALSVLAGIAAPASALDAKKFWEQYDRTHSIN